MDQSGSEVAETKRSQRVTVQTRCKCIFPLTEHSGKTKGSLLVQFIQRSRWTDMLCWYQHFPSEVASFIAVFGWWKGGKHEGVFEGLGVPMARALPVMNHVMQSHIGPRATAFLLSHPMPGCKYIVREEGGNGLWWTLGSFCLRILAWFKKQSSYCRAVSSRDDQINVFKWFLWKIIYKDFRMGVEGLGWNGCSSADTRQWQFELQCFKRNRSRWFRYDLKFNCLYLGKYQRCYMMAYMKGRDMQRMISGVWWLSRR